VIGEIFEVLFFLVPEIFFRLVALMFDFIARLAELSVPESQRSKVDRW
jgi:hypothetical protein